jgi:mRNA-degrading endonuclease RelE of RelBE toxin-antitoxin system
MVDGTPVLDIKPYVPYTDAHPGARSGWLDDAGHAAVGHAPADPLPAWQVEFESLAARQVKWIEAHTGLPLHERINASLSLGPKPNPYRRIRPEGEFFRLAVKEWRVLFLVDGRRIRVLRVSSGYRPTQLAGEEASTDSAIPTHRRFIELWPG